MTPEFLATLLILFLAGFVFGGIGAWLGGRAR